MQKSGTNIFIRKFIIILTACLFCAPCSYSQTKDVELLNDAVRNVTDIIMHDVFSPPVASRIYAYSSVAAYEIIQQGSDSFPSLYGRLNKMPFLQQSNGEVNLPLAGILAYYYTAQIFLPSYKMLNPYIDSLMNYYRQYISEKEILNSQLWAGMQAMKMMSWAGEDHFKEIHKLPRYELIDAADKWQPTPPDHADPVEPYWGMLRPFALDSSNQFMPAPFYTFSTDTNSQFYKAVYEVYATGKNLSPEQIAIAKFWDDNPFAVNYVGHLQMAEKKISPAGHWMDITRIAIEQSHADIFKAAQSYAAVSIAIADGFISCWKEKYTSNLIRPETYINKYIDPAWRPYLQTPSFPEYPSGHSVISAAAATMLTYLFGNDFKFTDVIETEFDLPERTFSSFNSAAVEASASRFCAGIHFRQSTLSGTDLGMQVSRFLIGKILSN